MKYLLLLILLLCALSVYVLEPQLKSFSVIAILAIIFYFLYDIAMGKDEEESVVKTLSNDEKITYITIKNRGKIAEPKNMEEWKALRKRLEADWDKELKDQEAAFQRQVDMITRAHNEALAKIKSQYDAFAKDFDKKSGIKAVENKAVDEKKPESYVELVRARKEKEMREAKERQAAWDKEVSRMSEKWQKDKASAQKQWKIEADRIQQDRYSNKNRAKEEWDAEILRLLKIENTAVG